MLFPSPNVKQNSHKLGLMIEGLAFSEAFKSSPFISKTVKIPFSLHFSMIEGNRVEEKPSAFVPDITTAEWLSIS